MKSDENKREWVCLPWEAALLLGESFRCIDDSSPVGAGRKETQAPHSWSPQLVGHRAPRAPEHGDRATSILLWDAWNVMDEVLLGLAVIVPFFFFFLSASHHLLLAKQLSYKGLTLLPLKCSCVRLLSCNQWKENIWCFSSWKASFHRCNEVI